MLCAERFQSNLSPEIPGVRNISHFKMELAKLTEGYAVGLTIIGEIRKSLSVFSPFVRVSSTLLPHAFLFIQWHQWREEESVQEVEVLNSVTNYIRYDSTLQLAEFKIPVLFSVLTA